MKDATERPRSSRLRRLSDEEIALWVEVAKSVAKRRGASLPTLASPNPPASPAPAAAPAAAPPARPPRPSGPPPLAPLERRLKRDLARGRSAVDSAIDLHGMNQAEAHRALRGFLVQAQSQGHRLVIVVTGKGGSKSRPDAASWIDEPGVLRRLAPHWLREADLRAVVLGFEEAGRAHGGAGALYVRLRRRDRR
ncbi:MAG TPA: Smr/MutS family protein [Roseiarcus sp.]|nr:Smr/MutS family protein [Roseiarcus sp.]